jgi:hypothetical protein
MKRLLVITVVMMLSASMAFAQMGAGEVGIYADLAGTNCQMSDVAPGLCTYYVVHVWSPGATAVQYSAPQPACLLASYLSDTAQFPVTIGSSQTGVAIGYGACLASPITTLFINYFCQGLTGTCCEYPVLPDPNVPSGTIEVVDCDQALLTDVVGLPGMVNGTIEDCNCDPTLATEESTWGKVKAIYGE